MGWFSKKSLAVKIMIVLGLTFGGASVLNYFWVSGYQHKQSMEGATLLAKRISVAVLSSLNNLMVLGEMEERAHLIRLFGAMKDISDVKVIRAKSLNKQWGEGFPEEKPTDEIDRKVLETGKSGR